jgi:hypothetical protein
VLALYRFPRYFDTPLKYFPIIVCYTLITELLGFFIRKFDEYDLFFNELYVRYNVSIYNGYNIIFYLYFYYVFESYLQDGPWKRIRLAGVGLFLLTAAINPFIQNFFISPQFYAYVVGALMLILYVTTYLKQQGSPGVQLFKKNDLLAWLGLGLLIFYIGYLPIKVMRHMYVMQGIFTEPPIVRRIVWVLILFMYGSFCIGLLRMRKMRYTEVG